VLWDCFTFFLSCHGTFHIYYHENIPTEVLLNRHIICNWSNRRKSVFWAETSWKYRDVMRWHMDKEKWSHQQTQF
jgi:hypothetical protein